MNLHIITGVSSGIGLALVSELISQGKMVLGIGRNSAINHPNYSFIKLDLSDKNAVENFEFPTLTEPFSLTYNAGVLGEIKPFGSQSIENASKVFQVNYLSATVLAHKALQNSHCEQLIFISSGAANRAIPSWSQYCASKAALNIFAETLQLELEHQNRQCKVMSIAPGVVDTPMQSEIRSTTIVNFSSVQQFIDLHETNALSSASEVAKKLSFISDNPAQFEQVCFSLRDVNLD